MTESTNTSGYRPRVRARRYTKKTIIKYVKSYYESTIPIIVRELTESTNTSGNRPRVCARRHNLVSIPSFYEKLLAKKYDYILNASE